MYNYFFIHKIKSSSDVVNIYFDIFSNCIIIITHWMKTTVNTPHSALYPEQFCHEYFNIHSNTVVSCTSTLKSFLGTDMWF
jgi:hypothetical protein